MRIAEVCPYDLRVPGGVQSQVRGLARELRRRGHQVDVVGPGAPGWEWIGPVVPVPANDAVARIALGPHLGRRLRRALSEFDVAHVHEPLMPAVSSAVARAEIAVVGTLHADPSPGIRRLLRFGYGRALLRSLVALTAVSPVAQSAVPGVSIEVIPNAVDDELRLPASKRSGSVLFVGRDEPRKGLSVLLEAWDLVHTAHPTAHLAVISDRVTGREDVEWLGQVDDRVRVSRMRQTEIVCAPNLRGESFGMIVAEALAAGCNVVATDIPAFRWVAGEVADYVPGGDAPRLAEQIINRIDRLRPADEVRESAARFSWREVGDRYEKILAEVRRSA